MPKGVAITHHNVTQLLGSLDTALPAAGAQVWTQWHSLASTLGLGDLGCALARRPVGGGARDGGGLAGGLSRPAGRRKVNVLMRTPVRAGAVVAGGLESIAFVVGGEACPAEVVDRWAPGRVMINAYGPTETTM